MRASPLPDPVALGIAGSLWLFLLADARLRRAHGRGVSRGRRFAFIAGLIVLLGALSGPIDARAGTSFPLHMFQHLLLTMVAAPLLVLAAPVTLALQAWPGPPRRRLVGVLHSAPVRLLGHPLVTWPLFIGTMWAAHLSPVYDAALRSEGVHALEHVAFLATALLFWMPVIRADPAPAPFSYPGRMLYLFAAMPAMAFLGLSLESAEHVLYPTYAAAVGTAQAIADQRTAGALMWGGMMVLIAPEIGAVLLDWMRADEREAKRIDARLAAGAAEAGATR